jgi:hypothetical protein
MRFEPLGRPGFLGCLVPIVRPASFTPSKPTYSLAWRGGWPRLEAFHPFFKESNLHDKVLSKMHKHQSVQDLEHALRMAAARIECRNYDGLREMFRDIKEKAAAAERHVKGFTLDTLWELAMVLQRVEWEGRGSKFGAPVHSPIRCSEA